MHLPPRMMRLSTWLRRRWIREFAMKKGTRANIPPKSNRNDPICFSPYLYRARDRLERFFNRIKQCGRVATRCDKLAANYLAFVQLASIRLWLAAANESRGESLRICRAPHFRSLHLGEPSKEWAANRVLRPKSTGKHRPMCRASSF
jgi:hypothetical protein